MREKGGGKREKRGKEGKRNQRKRKMWEKRKEKGIKSSFKLFLPFFFSFYN